MTCRGTIPAEFLVRTALLLAVVGVPNGPVRADIFQLVRGGQLRGIWLNSQPQPVEQYEIETIGGGRIVLDRATVQEVRREPAIERQYQQVVARHARDVAGQWAIAQWCRDHGLKQRRRYHLQRILRIDPDHAGARLGLGYSQVRGRWVTQEEFMQEQGYVLYRGRWQLPQQVELLEAKRQREVAEGHWYRQLVQWRRELGAGQAESAGEAIASVTDAHAIRALVVLFQREKLRPVKQLYVRALASIGTPEALQVLVDIVLSEFDEEVIHGCLDRLAELPHPAIQQNLLETLRHENNALVNRAGLALSRLGDDSSIGALIDALVTHHVVMLRAGETRDSEFVPLHVDVQNHDVLAALVQLTGTAGFGFDKKAWKQWRYLQVTQLHAQQTRTSHLRRGK